MHLDQAESGIGATVVYMPALEVGKLYGVSDRYAFVKFGATMYPIACAAEDLIWYHGPIVPQLVRKARYGY